MLRLVKLVFLVCFLIVPLTAFLTEDDSDYFPPEFTCPNSGFSFAEQLHWISEVWKRNAPYDIGYALLYSTLVVLPLFPFLCFMIPSKETLLQQYENEQKRRQTETESENDEEDEEEYCAPAVEPCNDVTRSKSLQLSKSDVSIGERLAAAVELNKPELCAPRVVMETPLTDEKEECEVTMAEEFPDLTTVDTADSFIRLKELGARICPESTLGKTCVMVAAGAFISYGIYRLISK
ncbi:hypothetical protein OS493_004125 [Desmophyllum pertusum]|uniref:Uncharacterized protein n=1 Tax=Desmophyllum pertusum TaxID=174260 RepID=A0A9W9ZW96_9CNID|nr:hypothetical protein OS493_004125 [Desmophyllum pertusum]